MRNYEYPGNVVSWRFDAPANDQSVAILVPEGTPDHIRIIAYNLDQKPVTAHMTGWEIDPGKWEVTQDGGKRTEDFERSRDLTFTFAPRTIDRAGTEAGQARGSLLVAARPGHWLR